MNDTYKYDFHCHINQGSKDSFVTAQKQIDKLIEKGFSGCLITDHNTYNGYRYIKDNIKTNNFYILKGIEYSTIDAGHILIVMPDEYDSNRIELSGAKLKDLIKYVHSNGGILGPAHPFSEPYLSIFSCVKYKNNYDICKEFDFIEVFNAGEKEKENNKASQLAKSYNLVTTAGSDSHYIEHCGMAYVELDKQIRNNNELIEYIKHRNLINVGGETYINQDRVKYDKYGSLIYFIYHLQIIMNSLKRRFFAYK